MTCVQTAEAQRLVHECAPKQPCAIGRIDGEPVVCVPKTLADDVGSDDRHGLRCSPASGISPHSPLDRRRPRTAMKWKGIIALKPMPSQAVPGPLQRLGTVLSFGASGTPFPNKPGGYDLKARKLTTATGRDIPRNARSPRSSTSTVSPTDAASRPLTRIWPSPASAHSRAARLMTAPMAV
jgi:hypothetical protein